MASNQQQQKASPQRTGGMGSSRGRIVIGIVIISAILIFAAAKNPDSAMPMQTASLWGEPIPGNGPLSGVNDSGTQRAMSGDSAGRLNVNIQSGATVAVSNFPATQPVSGTVAVSNFPASQPVTFASPQHVVVDSTPSPTAADPCQDVGTLKTGAFKQVSATSTLEVVALTGGQTIYPCGFLANQALAGTIQFVTGTGTNCATGQTAVSAAFATIANQPYTYVPAMTAMTIPVSQALCLTTTGITAPAQIQVTYVKK